MGLKVSKPFEDLNSGELENILQWLINASDDQGGSTAHTYPVMLQVARAGHPLNNVAHAFVKELRLTGDLYSPEKA